MTDKQYYGRTWGWAAIIFLSLILTYHVGCTKGVLNEPKHCNMNHVDTIYYPKQDSLSHYTCIYCLKDNKVRNY